MTDITNLNKVNKYLQNVNKSIIQLHLIISVMQAMGAAGSQNKGIATVV